MFNLKFNSYETIAKRAFKIFDRNFSAIALYCFLLELLRKMSSSTLELVRIVRDKLYFIPIFGIMFELFNFKLCKLTKLFGKHSSHNNF